jgi:hypothetical protein
MLTQQRNAGRTWKEREEIMESEQLRPDSRVRLTFSRSQAHELRAAYLRDLLSRPMRAVRAWQWNQAPSLAAAGDEKPAAAAPTPAPGVTIVFATATAPGRATGNRMA